jgi:hypothetical protein
MPRRAVRPILAIKRIVPHPRRIHLSAGLTLKSLQPQAYSLFPVPTGRQSIARGASPGPVRKDVASPNGAIVHTATATLPECNGVHIVARGRGPAAHPGLAINNIPYPAGIEQREAGRQAINSALGEHLLS